MQNTIEFGSGDNTTTSTSSQLELQHAPVNRVTIKPPPFLTRLFGFDKWNPSLSWLELPTTPPNITTSSQQSQKTSQSTCQWKLKTTAASKIASLKSTRSQKRNSSKKHWEQFHWTDKIPQFASCASSASFQNVI